MPLSYKARRRWALVILLVGMPLYVVAAVNLIALVDRPSFPVELAVYVGLGFLWILPFRFIFRGIGQPDPERQETDGQETARQPTDGQGPSV